MSTIVCPQGHAIATVNGEHLIEECTPVFGPDGKVVDASMMLVLVGRRIMLEPGFLVNAKGHHPEHPRGTWWVPGRRSRGTVRQARAGDVVTCPECGAIVVLSARMSGEFGGRDY